MDFNEQLTLRGSLGVADHEDRARLCQHIHLSCLLRDVHEGLFSNPSPDYDDLL